MSIPGVAKGRILIIDDDDLLRDALAVLLTGEDYEVSLAATGHEALWQLYTERLPDIILLDLKMPGMDGWEFRRIQKDDPKLGLIPVVVTTADDSAQAAAISAQAYMHKPIDGHELLCTLERVLGQSRRQSVGRVDETERLAALGRIAANIGHEINNPLTFIMANLTCSLDELDPSTDAPGALDTHMSPEVELARIKVHMASISDMLRDCQVGAERIRDTVGNLQRLSRAEDEHIVAIDIHKLIEQSLSMASEPIRRRARLVKSFGRSSWVRGNGSALGQVFLNLLLNAAQAIPEGDVDANEIRVSTQVVAGKQGPELVVAISDSGAGIPPEVLARIFEPFFTTKSFGEGTGLGLSISRQTVIDHGGRLTVESELGHGAVVRVFLPVTLSQASPLPGAPSAKVAGGPTSSASRKNLITSGAVGEARLPTHRSERGEGGGGCPGQIHGKDAA